MQTLRELQEEFWHALTATPGTSSAAPELLGRLPPSATQTSAERLQVYVDAYLWRLQEVMSETFEKTSAAATPETFAVWVRDYLMAFPSRSPSISYVGRNFARYLESRSDAPPWFADLASLEWTRAEVFESADTPTITTDALRQLMPEAWGTVRFEAIPGLAMLESAWPIHTLWSDPAHADVASQPTQIRVWRAADYRVLHAAMGEREAAALTLLVAGETFPSICVPFADLSDEEAPRAAMGCLLRWVEDGIVANVG